jgi:hypothetical protein
LITVASGAVSSRFSQATVGFSRPAALQPRSSQGRCKPPRGIAISLSERMQLMELTVIKDFTFIAKKWAGLRFVVKKSPGKQNSISIRELRSVYVHEYSSHLRIQSYCQTN